MRLSILIFSLIVMCIPVKSEAQNPQFDPSLADSLGADDYGMKNYTLVLLKTGPNDTTDQVFIGSCFQSHFQNMQKMAEAGYLALAGPTGKNSHDLRGLFVIDETDATIVLELLGNDRAIASGLLKVDLVPWYGSAALPSYLVDHDRIWKKKP